MSSLLQITGALWPLKASVYHIQTTQGERHTETLASQIVIGLQPLVPLANLSSLLNDIVKRVSEVIDIVVQGCLKATNKKTLKKRAESNIKYNNSRLNIKKKPIKAV